MIALQLSLGNFAYMSRVHDYFGQMWETNRTYNLFDVEQTDQLERFKYFLKLIKCRAGILRFLKSSKMMPIYKLNL